MIDNAAIFMQTGSSIAAERISSVNDNTMQSHFHPYYELFYLEKGTREVVIGDHSFSLQPHDFIIFPPYTMHHSFSGHDIEFSRVVLYFKPEVLPPEIDAMLQQNLQPHTLVSPEQKLDFYHQLCQLISEQEHPDSLFHDQVLFLRLELLLMSGLRYQRTAIEPHTKARIAKIVKYIHNHYDEDLGLEALATRFFVNKYHLCREFKRFTMCNFVEYVNKIRVLHAQRLFVESDKTITQIAMDVGFGSLTHFERVFFQHTGQKPKKMCTFMREQRDHNGIKSLRVPPLPLSEAPVTADVRALNRDSATLVV